MVFSRTGRPVAGRPTTRMVPQVAPLLLLVLSLCVACASAASWAAAGANCTAVPLSSFGAPIPDLKTMVAVVFSLDDGAMPASSLCPGLLHKVKLKFPEKRVYIASASQGAFAGGTTTCPNRVVGTTGASSVVLPLTLPCGASGTARLMFASVAANKTAASVYKQLNVSLPVAALSACPASSCAGAFAPSAASAGTGTTGTTGATGTAPATSSTGASAAADGTVLIDLSNLLALLSPATAATGGAVAADPLSALRGALTTFASSLPPLGGSSGAAGSATPLSGLVSVAKTIGSVVNQGASSAPSSGGGLSGLSQLVGAVQQIGSVLTKNATSSATTGANGNATTGDTGDGGGILGLLDSLQTIELALSGGASSDGSDAAGASKLLSALESVGSLFSPSGGTASPLQGLLDTGQGVVSALSDLLPMGANGTPTLNMQGVVPFVQAVGSFFKQLGALGAPA